MSYIHIPHRRPLDHRPVFQLLQTHAEKLPNKDAIVFRNEKFNRVSLTFLEYDRKSRSLAAGLLEIGVGRGDRVLVLLPSHLEFVLFFIALNRIGAIMIASEECSFEAVLETPELACVIAEANSTATNNDKVLNEIKKALYQHVIKAAVLVGLDSNVHLWGNSRAYKYQTLYALAEKNPKSATRVRNAEAKVQMDDPCLVVFSSGSTSLPKPIEFTHHAVVNGILASAECYELTQDSIFFNDLPFDWVAGILDSIGSAIVVGLTYVAFPPKCGISGHHTLKMVRIIQEERVTHVAFLLHILQDIISCKESIKAMNLKSLQYICTGGQPTPFALLKALLEMFPDIHFLNTYGSTEVIIIAVQKITKSCLDSKEYGIMRTVPGLEVKIVNEEGQLVPTGEKGEICVRSAWTSFCNWCYTSLGLTGRVDATNKCNGWQFTKDVGVVVNKKCIRLLDRLDFMIKVASESIPPALIENTLQEHSAVKKVCVVGVPDERLSQKICACIILEKDQRYDKVTLSNQFDQMSKEKLWESSVGFFVKPHYYVFLESFPLTRTGKVSRNEVRDIAIKELELTAVTV